jgi:hypothetical protein
MKTVQLQKILELVENSAVKKAQSERFITAFPDTIRLRCYSGSAAWPYSAFNT